MLPRSKSTNCMPLMYLRSEDAHCKNLQACFEKISEVLREYPYAQKIHELTKLYVFSFDIRKVVVKENSSGISKLCFKFYYFLASKIMLSTWDSRHNSQNPPIPLKPSNPPQQNPSNPKSLRSTSQQIPNSLTNSLNETNPNCQTHNYTNTKTNTNIKINVEGNGGTSVSAEKIQQKKEIGQSGKLEGEEPVLVQIMVKACADVKEAYCELTQSYSKMIVKRLEILCFIVALMGPIVLQPLMQTIQTQLCCKHQDHPNPNNPNTSSSSPPPNSLLPPPLPSCTNSIIQEQLFIILNYYTLGNLISNNAFSYLHKKYIKLVIPRVENKFGTFQLQKSLKVIKHRVEENKATVCKIRSFRNFQNDKGITKRSSIKLQDKENMWSLKKIKKFIKQALKIKQDTVLQSTNHIQPKADPRQQSISKLQQALYPTHPTKQSLLLKQNPLNKHILSSQLHNLKFTILNTSSSCSQQKKNTSSSSTSYYYKNNKQLNYKIKKPSQKINKINRSSLKENALVVNTQRKQGKFKKISKIYPVNHNYTMSPLSANHCHGEKQKVKEEAIQVIKVKLKGFKDYAIQDRASIERFQPFSRKKENKYRFSFQNNVTQTFDSFVQSKRQTQIQNPRKQIILQKLQRTQDFITPNPTTNPQSQPRNPSLSPPTHQYKSFNYPNQNPNRPPFNETNLRSSQKLAKISRNFKKDKQLFMNGCRKRQEVIFQDSNQRVKFDYI